VDFLLFRYSDEINQKVRNFKKQGAKPLVPPGARIGLRHTYERVYNNGVFGESNIMV